MNKHFLIGLAVGIGSIWLLKNTPVVSAQAAPILAKMGL